MAGLIPLALVLGLQPSGWRQSLDPASYSLLPSGQPSLRAFGEAGSYREKTMSTAGGPVLQVRVLKRGATGYAVQVQTPRFIQPIRKGDNVFLTYRARCLEGPGSWGMYVQQGTEPWTGLFSSQSNAGRDWKTFYHAWTSDRDWAADSAEVTFHIAGSAQTLEFSSMEVINAKGTPLTRLPLTPMSYVGRDPKAAWRREAARRIERFRKADLKVRVLDERGRPLQGRKVAVRMQRHAFEFGSFVEQPLVWKNPDGDRYRAWFLKAYNKATAPMYWADWGWESPVEHARYFQYADWFRDHRIPTKAHVLIYPGFQFMPSRLRITSNPNVIRGSIMEHIETKLNATRKYGFVSWDILNELRDLKDLAHVFGSERIYVDIFKKAHAVDPRPDFYLNENTILTNGGATENEQAEFERQLRYLVKEGAPVEGIGMQGHFGESLTPPETIWKIADRFAKFGLPIQITEFDINTRDEAGQADYTRDLLTAWFAHPATTGFTMWGFWEGSMWQPYGAMVRKDWSIKPNGQAWLDLIHKRWWTNKDLVTDRQGYVRVRGFKGDYLVTVAGQSVRVRLDGPATQTVRVPASRL
ncbi:MAG TPA: endo-1,4-beta-xylanase [Fimbriimonas sp.]